MEWYMYPVIIAAGMAAGFINTLAGSGSCAVATFPCCSDPEPTAWQPPWTHPSFQAGAVESNGVGWQAAQPAAADEELVLPCSPAVGVLRDAMSARWHSVHAYGPYGTSPATVPLSDWSDVSET